MGGTSSYRRANRYVCCLALLWNLNGSFGFSVRVNKIQMSLDTPVKAGSDDEKVVVEFADD